MPRHTKPCADRRPQSVSKCVTKYHLKDGTERYRVRMWHQGVEFKKDGFTSQRLALNFANDRKRDIRLQQFFPDEWIARRSMLATDAIDEYLLGAADKKSYADEVRYAQWWKEYLGPLRRLSSINATLVDAAQFRLKHSGRFGTRQAGTVNRHTDWLRHFMNVQIKMERFRGGNPALKIDRKAEPKGRIRFLEPHEETRLSEHLGGYAEAMEFAILSGCRQDEQFRLRWPWISFERRLATLPTTKVGESQLVHLNSRAIEILTALKARASDSENGYVFDYLNADTGKRMTGKQFYKKVFASAVQDAKLDDVDWHALRHTFGARLGMAGCNAPTIMALGRWSSIKMVERYTHLNRPHLREAIEKVSHYRELFEAGTSGNEQRTVLSTVLSHETSN